MKIPPAVQVELDRSHPEIPAFIQVTPIADQHRADVLAAELDRGEAEAIVLAKEINADLLLIDEALGRVVAVREGVPVIGLMGALILAKRKGLVTSVRELVASLQRVAGFYVSESVKDRVFREAGEA